MAPSMKVPAGAAAANPCEGGERKNINPELWYACAGPLVNLPPVGSYVVYFPQGHSEQVAASMQKDADAHIPNYPNLPPKLICLLHNVTLHADAETDEVYAQMTLQPVNTYEKETLLASDLALKPNRPQTEFFCKTLTASDTSTHGGFSVPRRSAEKIFPPLDFNMQPPAQELSAKDLHENTWTFRHIYRGQPKRHLLTTGWSLFVSGKRLFAGDSVLFIRDEKQQLLLGTRRANRQPTNISSSVLSSDSMHIGILAAAAHAAANQSPFTIFYNPRASPSEFVIPLAKYNKAIYSNQISPGMRFRMMFETEESGTRRYMGTITGVTDLDSVRWKHSPWRNLQVGWDESTTGERRTRVSIWEIEPVAAPFFLCPPPFFRPKRSRQPGMPDDDLSDMENLFKRTVPWIGEDHQSQNSLMSGLSLVQWMKMQQNPSMTNTSLQPDFIRSLSGSGVQNLSATDLSRQLSVQSQLLQHNNLQFDASRPTQQNQQFEQLMKGPATLNSVASLNGVPQQQLESMNQQRQQLVNQSLSANQGQVQSMQPQIIVQNSVQQPPALSHNLQSQAQNSVQQPPALSHNLQSQAHILLGQQQQQQQNSRFGMNQNQPGIPTSLANSAGQQLANSEYQNPLQLVQKFQQQQAPLPLQPAAQPPHLNQLQEQQRQLLEVSQQLPMSGSVSQLLLVLPQISKNAQINPQFSHSFQTQQKFQHPDSIPTDLPSLVVPSPPVTNLLSTPSHCMLPSTGVHSGITDDLPSCSTSPSTNNSSALPQTVISKSSRGANAREEMSRSGSTILNAGTLEAVASNSPPLVRESHQSDCRVKSSLPLSKSQPQCQTGGLPQTYLSNFPPMEYLETSSSGNSLCLSQNDGSLQQSFPMSSFNPSALLFRDTVQDLGGQSDTRPSLYGGTIDESMGFLPLTPDPLTGKGLGSGKDIQSQLSSGNMLASFENPKEGHQDIPSICQSFGVPDVAFDAGGVSMDSTINDGSFLNGSSWAPPPPQYQRLRTFTKVYKRGAVGRSVDITGYAGYDELKHDLARRFGIEGQLEDKHKVGWKLVYMDHENDILLVGDDPWEEFVKCVRCIKILSPQEVQQMSLDGDLGNNILPNQACSSSDGGNAWRSGNAHCDQNSGNPSGGSYDR